MAKICSGCGQQIRDLKELEDWLGSPLLYVFESYMQWKELKERDGVGWNESAM